eukprot:1372829-Amorphochlora_amoeboformis.AAC.1
MSRLESEGWEMGCRSGRDHSECDDGERKEISAAIPDTLHMGVENVLCVFKCTWCTYMHGCVRPLTPCKHAHSFTAGVWAMRRFLYRRVFCPSALDFSRPRLSPSSRLHRFLASPSSSFSAFFPVDWTALEFDLGMWRENDSVTGSGEEVLVGIGLDESVILATDALIGAGFVSTEEEFEGFSAWGNVYFNFQPYLWTVKVASGMKPAFSQG